MPLLSFDEIQAQALARGTRRVVVAGAGDGTVLEALAQAQRQNLVQPIAVGELLQIKAAAAKAGVALDGFRLVPAYSPDEAAQAAVRLLRNGEAEIYMKGDLPTAVFMRAALDKTSGLRCGRLLSHAAVLWSEKLRRMFIVTDGGINIQPTLEEKAEILRNALPLARALGSPRPKVAIMAAVEKASDKMPATMDALELVKRAAAGDFGECDVGGPFALDNAVSEEAAQKKGLTDPVAGHAEIMLMPEIHSGNLMAKAIMYFAECSFGGIVLGAAAPMIFLSRVDSAATRLNSIALGVLTAGRLESA